MPVFESKKGHVITNQSNLCQNLTIVVQILRSNSELLFVNFEIRPSLLRKLISRFSSFCFAILCNLHPSKQNESLSRLFGKNEFFISVFHIILTPGQSECLLNAQSYKNLGPHLGASLH
jgi:hypothetical protein